MGLRTVVLSGDSAPAVDAVASALQIDDARSGLSASQKVDAIHALQKEGRRVLMVGDGINDAPALASADVGCAIGSGTDAALANSGIALLGNDLEGVPASIGLARSTLAVIHENLGWAMGYNISALPLAAAGLLDPLVAAVAMGLSSLVVVLNSLRLRRFGASGLDRVRPPMVMRGARGFALSVALPVFLFAGVTVVGQAISPARRSVVAADACRHNDREPPRRERGGGLPRAWYSRCERLPHDRLEERRRSHCRRGRRHCLTQRRESRGAASHDAQHRTLHQLHRTRDRYLAVRRDDDHRRSSGLLLGHAVG